MPPARIQLSPVHWDLLKLIRALCYEGLPETRCALVDPNDRILPLWKETPCNTRFVCPDGVPEPFLRACFFAVPFDEAKQRWGEEGIYPDVIFQYLMDRGLLDTSKSNLPTCAAFRNLFDDTEIVATIQVEENEHGRFYSWDVLNSVSSIIDEQTGRLRMSHRVFKLTERAHELLDVGHAAVEPAKMDGGPDVAKPPASAHKPRPKRGRKPDTDPKADARIVEAWATRQYGSIAELERAFGLRKGDGKRAMDRHRKRTKRSEK
jgi:hypothetical protein